MLFENPAVFYNAVPQIQIPAKNHGVIEANTVEHVDLHNALIPVSATVINNSSTNNLITNTINNSNQASNGGSGSSGRSTPNLSNDTAPGKLFVGGLSWQTSGEKLREYFGMFGNVTDVLIMKDPITQRSRGFGFITFSEPCSVEKVLKVPIHTLDGKKIDPKYATPKNRPKQSNKTKKIFVGGVSQDTSADEVKAYFNQFGKVEETVLLIDNATKRHRGFGFVTFEKEDAVDRVCEIHFHTIKNKKVECKKAQPKETVTPATQLQLQKRLLLSGLGLRMPTVVGGPQNGVVQNPLAAYQAQAQAQVVQAQNAAAAAAAGNPNGSYGKLFATYPPSFHALRYAPYPMAPGGSMVQNAPPNPMTAAPNQQQQPQMNPNPQQYPGYSLANVDMSSFSGVDWSSMYGMYV
ncbi:unnamed protein product [Diamesa tonsa]